MNKPFYQLFIIHFIGSIIGILVIAGYYDIFTQTFALFDFRLAFWATSFVIVCYTIYKVAFKDAQKSESKSISSLQSRWLLFSILLAFWLPAILNYMDGSVSGAQKKESKVLLTTNKRSKQF